MSIIRKESITNDAKLNDLLNHTITNGECLEWKGCSNTDGYARMANNIKVHRLVYELTNQIDIKGLSIRHTCDNPKCINPLHLLIGSNIDNINDRVERNRTFKVITKEIVFRVKRLLDSKVLLHKEIATLLGIDPRRVSDIKCGLYSDEGKLIRRG